MKQIAFAVWLTLCLLIGITLGKALAAEPEPAIGHGLLCNTIPQIERFVELTRGHSANPQAAAAAINHEDKDPTACAFVAVAFLPVGVVKRIEIPHATYLVIEVVVVGTATADGAVQPVPLMQQYTVVQIKEVGI